MTHTSLGKIYDITPSPKGYFKLIIQVNTPFKTKFLKFNIWNDHEIYGMIMEDEFNEKDEVRVRYTYDNSFLKLISMEPQLIDQCQKCFTYYEANFAQRMDCPDNCSDYDEIKRRVDKQVMLVSTHIETFKYSLGRCLVFVDYDSKDTYNCRIYENHPIFSKIKSLQVGDLYRIVGWESLKCNVLDIIDIIISGKSQFMS